MEETNNDQRVERAKVPEPIYKSVTKNCRCGAPTKWRVRGTTVCTTCLDHQYGNCEGVKPWQEEKVSEEKKKAVIETQGHKCAHCGNKRRQLSWLEPTTMDTLVCSPCLNRVLGVPYSTQKTATAWQCGVCGAPLNRKNAESVVNHLNGHDLFADDAAATSN